MGTRNRNRIESSQRPSVLLRYRRHHLPPRRRRTFRAPRDHLPLRPDPRHCPQGRGAEPGNIANQSEEKIKWERLKKLHDMHETIRF